MTINTTHNTDGFTLLEVMIATTLFLLVMLGGITVLVRTMHADKVSKAMRQQIDTLAVALEDMTRNIRLGTHFHCDPFGTTPDVEVPLSCPTPSVGVGSQQSFVLAFEGLNGVPGNQDDQVVYRFFSATNNTQNGYLVKSREGDSTNQNDPRFKRVTPADISIDLAKSGFTVFGAEAGDSIQPRIIVRVVGVATYQETSVPFDLQTVVTPRTPDL